MSTHTYAVLFQNVLCPSNATLVSAPIDLTSAYGAIVTAQAQNGTTPPTSPCSASIMLSGNGTDFYLAMSGVSDMGASVTTSFFFEIPQEAMYLRVKLGGNFGATVTVSAQVQILSSI